MSTQQGFTGIWCPACDRAGSPARLVRQMSGKREGMLLQCPNGHQTTYDAVMRLRPRMDKPDFTEKQPAGTIVLPLWIHPEVLEAFKRKFPANWQTTLCSAVTALADPDSVLIEGEAARDMAAIGVKRGREVLGLAREVKELREKLAAEQAQMATLRAFFGGMGLAMPQSANAPAPVPVPSGPPTLVDGHRNPSLPPAARFQDLVDDGSGMLVPANGGPEPESPFTLDTGIDTGSPPAAPADGRPGFVTGNLR